MKNSVLNNMKRERQSTTALTVPRNMRVHNTPILTRLLPGKAVPIAAAGLFREDAVNRGRLNVMFEMAETAELLINPVIVKASTYLVPWLAFERFTGRDEFEASYSKKEFKLGDGVIDFIETMARGTKGQHPILDTLGLHAASTQDVSTMYAEAYNLIINHRNKNLSLDLVKDGAATLRSRLDTSFAAAEREKGRMRNIVESFDEASMEGSVEIDSSGDTIYVEGIGRNITQPPTSAVAILQQSDGVEENWPYVVGNSGNPVYVETDSTGLPQVKVNLQGLQMEFSLANIDRAKKMQAFAQLRQRYSGLDDDSIIDKLMDGIRMPDKMFEQPIYLGSEYTQFGFSKRYSTDSTNLDASVVQGIAPLQMEFATPRINTGGVIMIIAEIQPEQMYERQADPFFTTTDVDKYPQTIRDELDYQKVDDVLNWQIDTAHNDPNGLFGFEPMNAKWNITSPRIGDGYFEDAPTTVYSENRNRIWDPTPANPTIGEQWHLCGDIALDVFEFADANTKPFEVSGRLQMAIGTNTVFGKRLIESDGDYNAIEERVPTDEQQIDQPNQ